MKRPRSTQYDDEIGERLRAHRIALGFTQQDMAGLLGITYQQVHKYERGINRLSAGRLFEACHKLGIKYESVMPNSPVPQTLSSGRRAAAVMAALATLSEGDQDAIGQMIIRLAESRGNA